MSFDSIQEEILFSTVEEQSYSNVNCPECGDQDALCAFCYDEEEDDFYKGYEDESFLGSEGFSD
jgi:hypothetical protein